MADTAPLAVRREPETTTARVAELTVEQLVARQAKLQDALRRVMREGVHYGVIPGTEKTGKPTLLKPGAELLCSLFMLRPVFVTEQHTLDDEIAYHRVRCELVHVPTETVVATAAGSANSREKRHWRWTGEGKGRVRVPGDPYDMDNTALKMAEKRSLVAAVLHATAASDAFTQDLEDQESDQPAREPDRPRESAAGTIRIDSDPEAPRRRTVQIQAEAAAEGLQLDPKLWRTIVHGRPDLAIGVQTVERFEQAALVHGFTKEDIRTCWEAAAGQVPGWVAGDPIPALALVVWLAEIEKLHASRTGDGEDAP